MYLPVILERQFGIWGWIVFALPNVLGAAAFGWVLRDALSSRHVVDKHIVACRIFSAVTIAFQLFFLGWIGNWVGWEIGSVPAMCIAAAVGFVLGRWKFSAPSASLVLAVSMIAVLLFIRFDWVGALALPDVPPSKDLAAMAAICLLGFALCPYLDLTFHRARQSTNPIPGSLAFTLGFCVFFLAMIVFTLCYSAWMLDWRMAVPALLALVLGVHFGIQCGYTIALHTAALGKQWPYLVGAALLAAGGYFYPGGEMSYRLFMTFYALIFPAYVWIVMLWGRRIEIMVLAILAAAPFYYAAFFQTGRMTWALAGVGIILLIPLLGPYNRTWKVASTDHHAAGV